MSDDPHRPTITRFSNKPDVLIDGKLTYPLWPTPDPPEYSGFAVTEHPVGPLSARTYEVAFSPGKKRTIDLRARFLRDYAPGMVRHTGEGKLQIGPYRLRLVDQDAYALYDSGRYVLDHWHYRPLIWLYRLGRGYRWWRVRVVYTLVIWGLAEYSPDTLGWGQIKVIQWLRRRAGRKP